MSSRVKVRSKVVKATLENKDVLDVFQGVLGTAEGSATLSITYPKYHRIQKHVDRFIKLLTVVARSQMIQHFPGPREHLDQYVAALYQQMATSFTAPDFTPWLPAASLVDDYTKVPAEEVKKFNEVFALVKKCNLVNTIIVTCKNLIVHKKSIEDQSALKDRFLIKGSGMTFAPLPDLTQLNFKQLYIDDKLTSGDREFILIVLHKMFTISHDVYEAVSSPDVDVNEFVDIIMSSISEVKKHIPRCDQAFQKIIDSVDLLKGNFGDYYKDFTASGNPTIIMENFVLDVSKNTKSSPAVTAQFRRIIAHYRKLASQQTAHPKLQSLFDQVDANFKELEKRSRAADETTGDDEDSDDTIEGDDGADAGDDAENEPDEIDADAASAAAATFAPPAAAAATFAPPAAAADTIAPPAAAADTIAPPAAAADTIADPPPSPID
jgi:hypothetical protein